MCGKLWLQKVHRASLFFKLDLLDGVFCFQYLSGVSRSHTPTVGVKLESLFSSDAIAFGW